MYDDNHLIDQLVSEARTGYSCSYSYDANGNRATRVLNGLTETYSYDQGDKLQSVTWAGGSKSYLYDLAGRTTRVTSAAGQTNLSYDFEGRITGIVYPNASTNAFGYNGLDSRVSKTDSGGTKTFKRDGAYVTDPVLSDGAANYTPGISERRTGTTTYLHSGLKNADAQGTTGQAISGTRQYDAFGNLQSSTGAWNGPFGYAGGFGYQEDGDSGLKLLGHRYYDSSTGRFLSRDPEQHGRNWYAYCENSPAGYTDPSGLRRVDDNSKKKKPQRPIDIDKMVQYALDHAESKPKHQCAKYVRKALAAGGMDVSDRPTYAGNYGPFLKGKGAVVVNEDPYLPSKGDIVVYGINKSHPYGHIAIYSGKQWVSDFKQRSMKIWRRNIPPHTIYRLRGRKPKPAIEESKD